MDRTFAAQRARMELLAKLKKAAEKGKDAARIVAAKKAPINKFRRLAADVNDREELIGAIISEMNFRDVDMNDDASVAKWKKYRAEKKKHQKSDTRTQADYDRADYRKRQKETDSFLQDRGRKR